MILPVALLPRSAPSMHRSCLCIPTIHHSAPYASILAVCPAKQALCYSFLPVFAWGDPAHRSGEVVLLKPVTTLSLFHHTRRTHLFSDATKASAQLCVSLLHAPPSFSAYRMNSTDYHEAQVMSSPPPVPKERTAPPRSHVLSNFRNEAAARVAESDKQVDFLQYTVIDGIGSFGKRLKKQGRMQEKATADVVSKIDRRLNEVGTMISKGFEDANKKMERIQEGFSHKEVMNRLEELATSASVNEMKNILSTLPTKKDLKDVQFSVEQKLLSAVPSKQAHAVLAAIPSLASGDALMKLGGDLSQGLSALRTETDTQAVLDQLAFLATGDSVKDAIEKLQKLQEQFSVYHTEATRRAEQDDMLKKAHIELSESHNKLASAVEEQANALSASAITSALGTRKYQDMQEENNAFRNHSAEQAKRLTSNHFEIQDLRIELQRAKRRRVSVEEEEEEVPGLEDESRKGIHEEASRKSVEAREGHQDTISVQRPQPTPEPSPEPTPLDPRVYGDLLKVKAWDGAKFIKFAELSVAVQTAMLAWSRNLKAGWFDATNIRKISCASMKGNHVCMVTEEDAKVTCDRCAGGKTFCVRRREEHRKGLALFPLHPADRRGARIEEVAYWTRWVKQGSTSVKRGSKNAYTKKVWST